MQEKYTICSQKDYVFAFALTKHIMIFFTASYDEWNALCSCVQVYQLSNPVLCIFKCKASSTVTSPSTNIQSIVLSLRAASHLVILYINYFNFFVSRPSNSINLFPSTN